MRGVGGYDNLFLAEVTHKLGEGRFNLRADLKVNGKVVSYTSVPIIGALKLKGKATRNAAVGTAIATGTDVLTDGGQIFAVLTSEEAAQVRHKVAANTMSPPREAASVASTGSTASSRSTLFNWGNYKNRGLAGKAATRKAQHKGNAKAAKARSRSGSAASRGSAKSSNGNIVLMAGKKIYTEEGEGIHGEELRQVKRELAAKAK